MVRNPDSCLSNDASLEPNQNKHDPFELTSCNNLSFLATTLFNPSVSNFPLSLLSFNLS